MFIDFFYILKEAGIPVSPTSFLTFHKALSAGLVSSLEDFYTSARAILVKSRGAKLRNLVPHIPADRILIETDAPYLTPAPEKNKTRRNEPAFVKSVLLKLADVRGEEPDDLARIVYENTCRLYNI